MTGCTVLFKKKLLKMFDRFPPEISHDWWLALHASKDKRIKYIDKTLVKYRQHSGNIIGVNLIEKDNESNNISNIIKDKNQVLLSKIFRLDYKARDQQNLIRLEYINELIIKAHLMLDASTGLLTLRERQNLEKTMNQMLWYFTSYYKKKIRISAFFICLRNHNLFKQLHLSNHLFLLNSLIGNPDAKRKR